MKKYFIQFPRMLNEMNLTSSEAETLAERISNRGSGENNAAMSKLSHRLTKSREPDISDQLHSICNFAH